MNNDVVIKEAGWDAFMNLSGQNAEGHADRLASHLPNTDVHEKKSVEEKVRFLNTELRGMYGDNVPTDNTSPSLQKMRSAEHYAARAIKSWTLDERFLAMKILPNMRGIWIPLIARVIEQLDIKKSKGRYGQII